MRLSEFELGDKAAAAGIPMGHGFDPVGAVDAGARANDDAEAVRDGRGIALEGDRALTGIALAGRSIGCSLLAGLASTGASVAMVMTRLGAEAGRLLGLLPRRFRRVIPARPDRAVLRPAERRGDVPGVQVLARMLAGDESVYELGDAGLRRLRQSHTWLGKDRVLVVPINMMGKKSLSRAIYEAYNAALPPEV